MTTDTDLIAQADAAIDNVQNAPKGLVDPFYVAQSAALVPALRDALAAERARVQTLEADLTSEIKRRQHAEEFLKCYMWGQSE